MLKGDGVQSDNENIIIPPKAFLLLFLIALAFGSGWPLMKYGVVELPVLTFRWMTAILSGIGVLSLAAFMGHKLRLYREEIRIAFICALFNVTGWFYFSGLGLTMLSSGRATILAYTHPLFAFLIAYAMGRDQLTMRRFLALFAGCVPSPPCRPGISKPSVNRPSACSPSWAARFVLRSVQLCKSEPGARRPLCSPAGR